MSKKIIVYRNQENIEAVLGFFKKFKKDLKKIVIQFADLGIGSIESKDDFNSALSQPELFVKGKAADFVKANHNFEGAGIKLKSSALVDMLDFKELDEFVSASNKIDGDGRKAWQELGDVVEGEPVLSEELKIQFVDRETVYASTASEIAAYNILKPIVDGIQKLNDLGLEPIRFNSLQTNQWLVQGDSLEARINIHTFKNISGIISRK